MLNHRRSQGFSAVELMIVVVVTAVLAALALPSYRSFVINGRIRTTAESMLTGLQLARTEAIRLNTNVSFTLNSGTGWTVAVVSPAQTLQTRAPGEVGGGLAVTTNNSQTSATFQATGRVTGYGASSSLTQIAVTPAAGVLPANQAKPLQIDIFAGGQSRLCDPSSSLQSNDPRRC